MFLYNEQFLSKVENLLYPVLFIIAVWLPQHYFPFLMCMIDFKAPWLWMVAVRITMICVTLGAASLLEALNKHRIPAIPRMLITICVLTASIPLGVIAGVFLPLLLFVGGIIAVAVIGIDSI